MPVTARTGEDLTLLAILASGPVVAQRPGPAVRQQVQRRIHRLPQAAGPEIAPLQKNVVDGRFDAVIVNTASPEHQMDSFVT